jgi:hypothetical protein
MALMVVGGALWAQGIPPLQTPAPKVWHQKLFDIKYANVRDLYGFLYSSLHPHGNVTRDDKMRVISVGSESEAVLQSAAEIIRRFDVPSAADAGRNIEVVAHIMLAAPKGASGDAVPTDLAPTVQQLKAVFGYNDFQLVDSAVLRTREGVGPRANGNASLAPGVAGMPNSSYELAFENVSLTSSDKGNIIRLNNFRFSIRSPEQGQVPGGVWTFTNIGFHTNLDLREGQKAVVGKSKIDGSDRALILVVSARAVD